MAFTPKTKDSIENKIKNALLDGYVVRYDFRDEEPIEIMVRECIPSLPTMRNIGLEDKALIEKVYCSHDIIKRVFTELSQSYSVRKVWCGCSGCCQYSTYGIYVDGE